MKIMIFTEGTALMFQSGANLSREERVKESQAKEKSVYDFASYMPAGRAVEKLKTWVKQGAQICYLTSHEKAAGVEIDKQVLAKYGYPPGEIFYRQNG